MRRPAWRLWRSFAELAAGPSRQGSKGRPSVQPRLCPSSRSGFASPMGARVAGWARAGRPRQRLGKEGPTGIMGEWEGRRGRSQTGESAGGGEQPVGLEERGRNHRAGQAA